MKNKHFTTRSFAFSTKYSLLRKSSNPTKIIVFALVTAFHSESVSAQTIIPIQNNSFESQAVGTGLYESGLGTLTGWTISGGNGKISLIDPNSSGVTTATTSGSVVLASQVSKINGANLLGLTNNGTGATSGGKAVSQVLTGFVPGEDYTFSGYFGSQYNQAAQFIASDSIILSLSNSSGATISDTILISSIPGVTTISASDRTNNPAANPDDFQGALDLVNADFSASEVDSLLTSDSTPLTLTIENGSPSNSSTSLLIDDVSLTGTAAAVPEPSSLALFLMSFLGLGAWVIRARRHQFKAA